MNQRATCSTESRHDALDHIDTVRDACEIDKQKIRKDALLERMSEGQIHVEFDKEEKKKLTGSFIKKKLSAVGCPGRNSEQEKIRGRRNHM